MGLLDSNKRITRPDFVSGSVSETFTASKNFSFTNTGKYRYLIMRIVSDQHSSSQQWDCYAEYIDGSSLNPNFIGVNGGIFDRIRFNGYYFVDTMYANTVSVYFQGGTISKTITIDYVFCSNPPLLQDARPITKLFSTTITMEENTEDYAIGSLIGLAGYKFYFVAARFTTSSGGNAPMTFTITERYRDTFDSLTNKESPVHDLVTVQDSRSLNSDWFPVKSEKVSMNISIQEPVAGYKAYINVYGVR